MHPVPEPPTTYIATMNPKASQNGARNLPRPCTATPTQAAAASAPTPTRRPITFEPISIPSVQPLSTIPIPMFSTPRTSSMYTRSAGIDADMNSNETKTTTTMSATTGSARRNPTPSRARRCSPSDSCVPIRRPAMRRPATADREERSCVDQHRGSRPSGRDEEAAAERAHSEAEGPGRLDGSVRALQRPRARDDGDESELGRLR